MAETLMTDVEAEALDSVLEPDSFVSLHNDTASGDLEDVAKIVDILIYDQEPLSSAVVGYRKYSGVTAPAVVSEPGFLVLAKDRPSGDNVVEVTILPGFQVLELAGAYVLGRYHGLLITETDAGFEGLVLQQGGQGYTDAVSSLDALTAAVRPQVTMSLNSGGLDPLTIARKQAITAKLEGAEEFFNHAHGKGGKFTSGGGSKGSGGSAGAGAGAAGSSSGGSKSTGQKVASAAKKAVIVAAVVLAVVGLVALGGHSDTFNPNRPGGKTDRNNAARDKEKADLNKRSGEMQKRFEAKTASDRAFIENIAKIHAQNAARHGAAKSVESGKTSPGEKAAADKKLGTGGSAGKSQAAGNTLGGHISERYDPGKGATADARLHSREAARGVGLSGPSARQKSGYTDTLGGMTNKQFADSVNAHIKAEGDKRVHAAAQRGQQAARDQAAAAHARAAAAGATKYSPPAKKLTARERQVLHPD